jgi:hypothetical protein
MFYQLTNDFAGTEKAKVDMFGARCEERTLMTRLRQNFSVTDLLNFDRKPLSRNSGCKFQNRTTTSFGLVGRLQIPPCSTFRFTITATVLAAAPYPRRRQPRSSSMNRATGQIS